MKPALTELANHLGPLAVALPPFRDECAFMVNRDRLLEVAATIKNHPTTPFDVLVDVTGVDYIAKNQTLETVYHFRSSRDDLVIRLRVAIDPLEPSVSSLAGLYKSAIWLEREVMDLFGIRFTGHPDPRRLLLPDDYEGFPLRKEHPLCPQGDGSDW